MSSDYHSIPRDVFHALATGGGGTAAIQALNAAEYSKHLLALRGVLGAAQAQGGREGAAALAGYDLLSAAQQHDPATVRAVIQHPSVGAWALRTLHALRGGRSMPGASPAGMCAVAAAAAIRAGLAAQIQVQAVQGVVMLPSVGAASVRGDAAVVRSDPGYATVTSGTEQIRVTGDGRQAAPGWRPLRRWRVGSLDVLIDDIDPFRMPAVAQVGSRLSSLEAEQWKLALENAWEFFERDHPQLAREIAAALRVIVPLKSPAKGEISASSTDSFGALALSRPVDRRTYAATLAHEVQHLKLSALSDIITLLRPDDGRLFYAPWRNDPRPIGGLLQGTYAFLGVSGFWRRQRQLDRGADSLRASAEFARWRLAALIAARAIQSSGQLTAAGTDFVAVMVATLTAWHDEPVPEQAGAQARREADEHMARWRVAHGPISI